MPPYFPPRYWENFSVLREFWGPTSPFKSQGAPHPFPAPFVAIFFPHQFLLMPQCPIPLLGRDILLKFKVSITFNPALAFTPHILWPSPSHTSPNTKLPLPPDHVDPCIWDTKTPSLAKCPPIQIHLKDSQYFPSHPQYPLPTTSLRGLQPVISDLLQKGFLRPTHSPYNTPILAIKKPNRTFCLVQGLRLINVAVKPIRPLVPNPYTILSLILGDPTHFSVIDLKDAFFTIPLAPSSQDLFAFTWTDPDTRQSQQLTWSVLPQGFQDSPHIFGQTLAKDLKELTFSHSVLLQYVDDLLLCSPFLSISKRDTNSLLNFLAKKGYQAFPQKVQLSQKQVTYLGVQLAHTTLKLSH